MGSPRQQVVSLWPSCCRSLGAKPRKTPMADPSPWKTLLEEPNALGWLLFLVLVIAIGAGALYLGPTETEKAISAAPASLEHAAR